MWLNWVFDYVWFTEYQSPMEINDSQDRAPFGDLTNHTNEGADSESNLQPATNSTVQR